MLRVQEAVSRPQVNFGRKQLHHWKREAKAKAYRSGTGINADADKLEGSAADVVRAAHAKRARKNEKRVMDDACTTMGQFHSRIARGMGPVAVNRFDAEFDRVPA